MNNELPIQLYKANAELQLQITRLLQESGHHWLEAMQQLSAGGVLETTSRIQNLQQAADWQALATLPSEVFWRLCQGRMGDTQAVGQAAERHHAHHRAGGHHPSGGIHRNHLPAADAEELTAIMY